MAYPMLEIKLDIIKDNVKQVNSLCNQYGLNITGVTKVFSAAIPIVQAYIEGGIKRIGDARIENLKKLKEFDIEKWLIRVPPFSQIKDVILYCDVSLNSELSTIIALNNEAKKYNKIHKVILMVDLGDLREGYISSDDLLKVSSQISKLSNIELYGIGTNLSCFSYVVPSKEKMKNLEDIAKKLPIKNPIVSGGNSGTLNLMLEGDIPSSVNNMRLGESLLFGKERRTYTFLKNTRHDAFILDAEIVELKDKPSVPWGEIGVDSYGKSPKTPIDKGIIKRAILAIGKQDCDIETMSPVDKNVKILGASSDYLIVEILVNTNNYVVGDIIQFELGYFALMRAMTSEFVTKNYI